MDSYELDKIRNDGGELDIQDYTDFLTSLMIKKHKLAGTRKVRKINVDVIDELLSTGRKMGLIVNFNLERKVFIVQPL